MSQNQERPIKLSVHESSDPSVISRNLETEPSSNLNDLNDASHDDENVDVPTPGLTDTQSEDDIIDSPITIANLSAG